MAYRVVERTYTDKKVIDEQAYDSLEDAEKAAAAFASYGGPRLVQIVVLDDDGTEHFNRLLNDG